MNSEFAILFYYLCFLLMSAVAFHQYSNRILESKMNPVPSGLLRRYSDGSEDDAMSGNSGAEDKSVDSESITSDEEREEDLKLPEPPQPPYHRDTNAFARFVNEHDD